jgi:hypothetical protein
MLLENGGLVFGTEGGVVASARGAGAGCVFDCGFILDCGFLFAC